ncbi:39S ribosomal protein L44, mitochondrial [Aphelenchoides fujianensis]|nr:39S ribosomal protein L44, mitochondrial [Aphelenchoides fujianensis]
MFGNLLLPKAARTNVVETCRQFRAVWQRGYLKDLYHRRQLAGADPLVARSAFPNWHYPSEIAALKHRINALDLRDDQLVQALTNPTFFDRLDNLEGSSNPVPSREEVVGDEKHSNIQFINKGSHRIKWQLSAILRHRWPKAPEEFVQAIVGRLSDLAALEPVAEQLGLRHVVRTSEFPVTADSMVDALKAMVGVLSPQRVHRFVCEFILPPIGSLPLEDVLPFREPLPILEDYLRKAGKRTVEARLLHSSGGESAIPLYVVGIFADERLVGKSPGERISIAVDLAAQDALLKAWDVRPAEQSFCFVQDDLRWNEFEKPNHHIWDVVQKNRDTSLLTAEELAEPPLDPVQVADHYRQAILPEVGIPLRRHARHKFSRGSLAKRSFRYLAKPKVYTVS